MTSTVVSTRLLHLQGVRGIAIIFVVLFHFFPAKFSNGYVGVDMFFMLSGYLMTQMLERKDSMCLGNICEFLYRRWKRIVPLYYLVILVILFIVQFESVSLRKANAVSGVEAVLFATNLIRPSGMEGYFAKLGVAVDLFTHTWSLCLEMQFYFIFPFIFILYKSLPPPLQNYFVVLLASLSGFFYFTTDAFLSFNLVFSRIWQFLAGLFVYYSASHSAPQVVSHCEEEGEKLVPDGEGDGSEHEEAECPPDFNCSLLLTVCLCSLFAMILSPDAISAHFVRINSVLMTAMLLLHGKNCSFLENKYLVYIGEVSYAWYLVHWPIAAMFKLTQLTCSQDILLGVLISFVLSVLLHHFFEKYYLSWGKTAIVALSIALFLANCGIILSLEQSIPNEPESELQSSLLRIDRPLGKYNYPSDYMDGILYGYENKTSVERMALNEYHQATDIKRSLESFCPKFKTVSNPKESRCELNEGVNKTANLRLLVIGNSWSSNLFKVMHEECKQKFSHMEISFTGGCEAMTRSDSGYYNCTYDYMFLDAVREVQPDVLFIIDRHFKMMEIVNGSNPFDDEIFKIASERLAEIEKIVKKKIYILDAFPDIKFGITQMMRMHAQSGVHINDADRAEISAKVLIAKLRLQRLVQECPKCRIFDYMGQFFFDGAFKLYDPEYFVAFFSDGGHLTPPGWERVRPLVRHICSRM